MLKFYYNGIKDSLGVLQKASFSLGGLTNYPKNILTIYADKNLLRGFSQEIKEAFIVENNSNGMTDYFENDFIRVKSDHPLYKKVLEAYNKKQERNKRLYERK